MTGQPLNAKVFSPVNIGPLTLPNRFIKSATNEGRAKGAIVSKGLADFHRSVGAGGAAMTTVAYCAVTPDGRTFEDQVVMTPDHLTDLKALSAGVHAEGAAISAQLTHSGCFNFLPRNAAKSAPMSASGGFNKIGARIGRLRKRAMTRSDMDEIARAFVSAACLARDAGFDAVELHMGHGYLLSQFLSPIYNQRKDDFGGNIKARARFPIEVLNRVLEAVGDRLAVIVKFSVTDGHKDGNTVQDGIEIARAVERAGAHLAVLSNGLNAESVSSMFGSNLPPAVLPPPRNAIERKLYDAMKISGFDPVQFQELYLLENARLIRGAVSMPLCYLGGVQSTQSVNHVLQAGFETVALGRALLHDPALPNKWRAGTLTTSGCTACNECVATLHAPEGTHCVLSARPNADDNTVRAGHKD